MGICLTLAIATCAGAKSSAWFCSQLHAGQQATASAFGGSTADSISAIINSV
jgi:hypothetical protein